ncbi:nucleotidyltransferase domain-containing protein [Candidatus Woesearchaeota archaeon]|nr:nucleotidyltransferase domain-containing protein [Candidatus Woesearchaeota archaeon]
MQKLAIKEQIVKIVKKSGNGGAVWVPKNWLGQEVIVTLPDKPKLDLKEKIIHLLEPYLKDTIAVFVYGSYARHEETKESDIDVMVITMNKPMPISIDEPNLEITSFQLDKLKKAIEKYPVMYWQIVQEAVPLINSFVLDELKNIEISEEKFKSYIGEAKEHAESNKELIELDKLDGKFLKSYSALYSAILRLKGMFIINCISNNEKFSSKAFKEWILQNRLTNQEFEQCYSAYRAVRNDENAKGIKIKISVAEKLLNILVTETDLMETKLYGK